MWPTRQHLADQISDGLRKFDVERRALPGLTTAATREALTWQFVASLRRLEYTEILKQRPIDSRRTDPNSTFFDPERAAILHAQVGRLDEAFWLTFLATHFGKHSATGWRLLRDVYSGLGVRTWTWDRVSGDPAAFRAWLGANLPKIDGGFGNHRKYETLRVDSDNGTAAVVESYVKWVGPAHSHAELISRLTRQAGNDPHAIFHAFYESMQVRRFGRLGKFDFLALVGRLGLAPISPGSAYLQGATGPQRGARLLFGGSPTANLNTNDLDAWAKELGDELGVGMQIMEDALCNWQKSPNLFVHFRG